ncbi:retrovirus-related pol polyprotein from transposon TNT 1-94 [Tanacetum coccineum]|uniref:Retrovirus-related pol polyprotein from transposon TNT 1-94 n=1 Tax=Tanacetum coccineum TaxID=301880 RepID=A0ABQ4Y8U8_9ASTR
MSTQQDIYAIRAERLANTHDPLALMANTQTPFHPDQPSHITYMQHPQPNNNYVRQSPFNTNYMQQPMQNPEDISDPTTAIDMSLVLMAKAFKLNNTTPTNNNQIRSSNPRNMQIAQPGNQLGHNAVQNSKIQKIANQSGNGNVVAAQAEGNDNLNNENKIRCYNCQGVDHYARNCTIKPRKMDAAYLQTQLQIAQAGIQLNSEEFDFIAAAGAYDEIEEMDQLSNVISAVPGVEQSGGTVKQHPATVEKTRAYFKSLYNNLAIEVEKVNSVNRKMKETNADLTTELARYKNQEKYFEINQEKYDKLKRCYQKSVYQEQCLTKMINSLHLTSSKMITTLNEEIANLNNQLSKEKSIVSFLQEEKKKLKSDFKIREYELLDKQIQLENKIKELDNILVKKGQSIQTMHMLSPKPDSFYHTKQKMALGYQNPFYLKQAQ